MIFAIIVVLFVVAALTLPFFLAKQDLLQEASSINSIEQLEKVKESLLKRYLEDESAFADKRISEGIWNKRKHFLTTRYLDAARREDYLKYIMDHNK